MLKTFEVSFIGRTIGAIGIFYPITEIIQAENEEKLLLKLYDKYDHVMQKSIKEVKGKTKNT